MVGFDFLDIAKPPRHIYPRIYYPQASGYGWKDYIQSIGATAIFGRKFGELLQVEPSSTVCSAWKTVPLGMDYLGVSIATLKTIHKKRNDNVVGSREITRDIIWTSRTRLFSQCKCVAAPALSATEHIDPVQALLPKGQKLHLDVPKNHIHITLSSLRDNGAVVFGHTRYKVGRRPSPEAITRELRDDSPLDTDLLSTTPISPSTGTGVSNIRSTETQRTNRDSSLSSRC